MGHHRYLFGDLRTGKISRAINLVGGQWATVYDDADSISGKFPLGAINEKTGEPLWQFVDADTAPARQYMVAEWVGDDGKLEQTAGGPIWSRNHNDDTDELTLGAADLASIFDHRLVLPALVSGLKPELQTLAYTSAELGLIAKRLVQVALDHVAGSLPIVLPSDANLGGAGTRFQRTFFGYELGMVGERLKQLSDVEDGPEVQFSPRRRSDDPRYIEWVMRVGRPARQNMLYQSGQPWILDQSVPESAVISIGTAESAADITTTALAAGQGDGQGKPIEWVDSSELTDLGYPALHTVVGSTDNVTQRSTLRSHAGGLLARSNRPIRTHTAVIEADSFWRLAPGFRPGDFFLLRPREGHRFIREEMVMRSLQVSGGGDTISLQMAPVKAGI